MVRYGLSCDDDDDDDNDGNDDDDVGVVFEGGDMGWAGAKHAFYVKFQPFQKVCMLSWLMRYETWHPSAIDFMRGSASFSN